MCIQASYRNGVNEGGRVDSVSLPALPAELKWLNTPTDAEVYPPGTLRITAGGKTDWFIDPAGTAPVTNAPTAVFAPPHETFSLRASVGAGFGATFDAGVLFLYANEEQWAKLCFEYSPQHKPMIVSVVTQGVSDDCNSVVIPAHNVLLRIYRHGRIFAFHYSADGVFWHMVRYFTFGPAIQVQAGFSAQSPTGDGCTATFSDIQYASEELSDIRSGH